jgi:sulfate-transporting ATPase
VSQVLVYAFLSLPLVGAYALLGLGITVIYQASRVLNLAHGAMAMAGAYITYQAAARWNLPLPLAVVGGVAMGAVLGLVVERVFVRGLRSAGPTTQTVGTVAALTFAIALASRIWGTLPVTAPKVLPAGALQLPGGFVNYDELLIFPIGLAGAAGLFALFQLTDVGLAMRGAAQNRRGAALRGIDPDRTTALAWAIGGALVALTGILLAGAAELDPFSVSLGVLPAFIAALIGGLESMPGVLVGAAVIGVVEGMVPALGIIPPLAPIVQAQGAPQLVLGILALAVMAARGVKLATSEASGSAL